MCRNIRLLFNFDPPANDDEIRAAALQYVRKVTGIQRPSKPNQAAFDAAVDAITAITADLVRDALATTAAPRSREIEAERARARGRKREERLRIKILGVEG